MMLRITASAIAMALTFTAGTSYGFNLPSLPIAASASSNSGGINADAVDQFITTGQASNALITNASALLAAALSTKEKRAEIINQTEQLKAGLATGDKTAIEQSAKLNTSSQALITDALNNQSTLDNLKALTSDQRKSVVSSCLNIAYGVIEQKEQVTAGQNMISQIGKNPMLATKLPAIKNVVSTMTSNISGTASYIGNFPKLFKAMGVSAVLPTSTKEKPQPVSDSSWAAFNEAK